MNKFKVGDTVVCVYYYYNKTLNVYRMEHAFELYVDSIENYIFNGAKGLYENNIFKIKSISNDFILLDNGINIPKEHFDKIFTIKEVEEYIDTNFGKISIGYQKILNKSLEVNKLVDDIASISKSLGVDVISNSSYYGALEPIRSSINKFGWNTSSLTC